MGQQFDDMEGQVNRSFVFILYAQNILITLSSDHIKSKKDRGQKLCDISIFYIFERFQETFIIYGLLFLNISKILPKEII